MTPQNLVQKIKVHIDTTFQFAEHPKLVMQAILL